MAPVEVPLIGVEGRPRPAAELGFEGEVVGRGLGKNLRQARFERVGLVTRDDVKKLPMRRVAGAGRGRPRMLASDVVEHKVDAKADAAAAEQTGERLEVGRRPERGLDLEVVDDRIAAVGLPGAGAEKGHEVEVANAELLEVVETLANSCERSGKAVDVGDVADHVGPLKPVGHKLALKIERRELGRAGDVVADHRVEKSGEHGGGRGAVHFLERSAEVAAKAPHPPREIISARKRSVRGALAEVGVER